MKQAEILKNPIDQQIESWFKENKGKEFWFDLSKQEYGVLSVLKKDFTGEWVVKFKPIVRGNYLSDCDGLIPFNGLIYGVLELKTLENTTIQTPQKESIKLPYYINQDHVNRIITIAQPHQKPKVTIEIDDYNDLEFAQKIVNILNANL
jgi:hypothetical protein